MRSIIAGAVLAMIWADPIAAANAVAVGFLVALILERKERLQCPPASGR